MADSKSSHNSYQSPLETRNASIQMREIWSARRKHGLWRKIWLALAEAERELGLDIPAEAIQQMRSALDDIDFEAAAAHEKRLRHDVMAHVHAFGDAAPAARGIIHLGATSQDIVCNGDLLQLHESLRLVAVKLASLVDILGDFAVRHRDLATLGYTHFQPAQPTTVGKRAALWAQDFALALQEIEQRIDGTCLRGIKGATGTQASFLALFDGDSEKVNRLEQIVCEKLGWPGGKLQTISGQTYSRMIDAQIVNSLAVAAAAVHKCCNDLRLLANLKEIEEPFESEQIGSSAMAYKRNPMRCERATGLARFVMSMAQNPLNTAATQWFERTLDDSSNRRLSLPEPFLALDGALDLMINVCGGLVVYPKTIEANLMAELPFMATEELLMLAVRQGADRQAAHELIRRHAMEAARQVKQEGRHNDLLERLSGEAMFSGLDFLLAMDPSRFVGRAPVQVDQFVATVVEPIRRRYAGRIIRNAAMKV